MIKFSSLVWKILVKIVILNQQLFFDILKLIVYILDRFKFMFIQSSTNRFKNYQVLNIKKIIVNKSVIL